MADNNANIYNTWPIAKPGLPFIAAALALAALFWLLTLDRFAAAFFLLALFITWFFRDPNRPTPPEGFGLSPADGKIIKVELVSHNPYTEGAALKISVFMNLFSVHVNRVPATGRLLRQIYHPGRFLNANLDKASEHNERNALIMETESGDKIAVVQIAGLIARRIVSWVGEGEHLVRGQRFGLIRFGSRLDLYLPPESRPLVTVGQQVFAGWSPLWR